MVRSDLFEKPWWRPGSMKQAQSDDLKIRLKRLLGDDEAKTLGYLEEHFQIPRSTASRFVNGITRNPRLKNLKKIEKAVYSLEKESCLIPQSSSTDDALRHAWERIDEVHPEDTRKLEKSQCSAISASEITYKTYRAATSGGEELFDREEIRELVGEGADFAIDFLIEAGLLIQKRENGKLQPMFSDYIIEDIDTLKALNVYDNMSFNNENVGSAAALARASGSLSLEGIEKARLAVYRLAVEFAEIKSQHPGKIPFYANAIMNLISNRRYNKSLVDEKNENA